MVRGLDRDGLETVDATDLRLRRIDIDEVRHAGAGIEPVDLVDLLAPGGRHEQIVGHVLQGPVDTESERAVAFDHEGRRAHRLLDHHVRGARDLA